ncbi:12114_t:CDS:2, partial [Cetraspora pellucida]
QEEIENSSTTVSEIASTFGNNQLNKKISVFPLIETRLFQLGQFLIDNKRSTNFENEINILITSLDFQPEAFTSIFQSAFEKAYQKYKTHVANHPAHSLFKDSQLFDPRFISLTTANKNILFYKSISELSNLSA